MSPTHLMLAMPDPGRRDARAPDSRGRAAAARRSSRTRAGRRPAPSPPAAAAAPGPGSPRPLTTSASRPRGSTSTACRPMPARRSTSASRTPRQRAAPIAPERPGGAADRLRPAARRRSCGRCPRTRRTRCGSPTGSARRSVVAEVQPGRPCSPSPHTVSRQASASMRGVAVWLRTKNRSAGVSRPVPLSAAKLVSALVPRRVNSSGGSGLTMPGSPAAACAAAGLGGCRLCRGGDRGQRYGRRGGGDELQQITAVDPGGTGVPARPLPQPHPVVGVLGRWRKAGSWKLLVGKGGDAGEWGSVAESNSRTKEPTWPVSMRKPSWP